MISNQDRSWLNLAGAASVRSSCKHKLGAVATKGGSVLAISANKTRNLSVIDVEADYYTEHAEAKLLRLLKGRAAGTTFYVARISKTNVPRMARPCNACYVKLRDAGVDRVVYTDDHGIIAELKFTKS